MEAALHQLGVRCRASLLQRRLCRDMGVAKSGFGIFASAPVRAGTIVVRVPLHACIAPSLVAAVPAGAWLLERLKPTYTATRGRQQLQLSGREAATSVFTAMLLHGGPLAACLRTLKADAAAGGGMPSLDARELLLQAGLTDAATVDHMLLLAACRDDIINELWHDVSLLQDEAGAALSQSHDTMLSSLPRVGPDDVRWSHQMLQSRCNALDLRGVLDDGVDDGTHTGETVEPVWVPFVDYVNHDDGEPNVEVTFGSTAVGQHVVLLVACQDVAAGHELVYRYVEPPAVNSAIYRAENLHRFGFVPFALA
jgi:hypothetical protein